MEHLEELESTIRSFSEELIHELALRDELEFEKEVKNTFIASLIEVQNKQKEFRELAKRKRRSTGTSPNHWRERGAITVGRTIAPGTVRPSFLFSSCYPCQSRGYCISVCLSVCLH